MIETLLSLYRQAGHDVPALPPVRKSRASSFEGASTGRRLVNWRPSTEDINSRIAYSGDTLRVRARDVVRRNPWAAKAVEAWVSNLISTGIKPQWQMADAARKERTQASWFRWTDEADADWATDFYGLQALVARGLIEAGEVFIRKRWRRVSDGLFVPLQLQLLDAEFCPLTKNETLPNGNIIRMGIEFDRLGRRVAYHMYREHPGSLNPTVLGIDTQRIPADEIIHVYRKLEMGQIRGITWLQPVLVKLHELDQYDDAELVRKKTAAMFGGFITQDAPDDPILVKDTTQSPPAGIDVAGLEPGTFVRLDLGQRVEFAEPADVGGLYPEFMRIQLRGVAGGTGGLTYEQVTGDLTSVNYSSIRAGLLEFRRVAEQIQHQVFVYQFCRTVMNEWLVSAAFVGAIDAAAYNRDPWSYQNVRWIAPGWPWVDPLKDITATNLAIQCGLTSRSNEVSATGEDVEDIDRQQAADNARCDKLGLRYVSDGRVAAQKFDRSKSGIQGSTSERSQDQEMPMSDPKTPMGADTLERLVPMLNSADY